MRPEQLPKAAVTIVQPAHGWVPLELGEVWRFRDLLFMLVWRDWSAKYRQSLLGLGWAILNPAIQIGVYTVVFGRMARLPSDGVPYPIFCLAGLLPWLYFSNSLVRASGSTVAGTALLTKVYFPRLILPLATVLHGLIEFAIQLSLLGLLMWAYGMRPGWAVFSLPLLTLLCGATSLSVGLWASALSVPLRDVRHLITFLAQMWMWLTPVAYSIHVVPADWRYLYSLNPMVGLVASFRWAILGTAAPDWSTMALSCSVMFLLLVGGLYFFRRFEAHFADVI